MFILSYSGLKSHTCAYYNYKDECHNSNEGCSVKTETCAYKTSHPGCYTLWNKDHIILQGCWAPSTKEECTPGDCVSKQAHLFGKSLFHFCCCYGNSCNKKYGLSNHVPRWPWTTRHSHRTASTHSGIKYDFNLVYFKISYKNTVFHAWYFFKDHIRPVYGKGGFHWVGKA